MIPVPSGVKVWLAQRLPRSVADGAGDAEARSDVRTSVRVPGSRWRSDQGDLA